MLGLHYRFNPAYKISLLYQNNRWSNSFPVMPRRAPEVLNGFARRGDAGMHRVFRGGWEAPSENPVQKLRRAGYTRHPGVVSFGFFSLDKQRKETRPPVREPASKQSVAIATQKVAKTILIPLTLALSHGER